MAYIKIDNDKWVKVNENNTAEVLSKTELEQQTLTEQIRLTGQLS